MKKAASENFLDSIETKHENSSSNSLLGGKSRFNTPGRSEDNILAAYSNSHILSTGAGTGTPGRIKKFCKRVRRRSVEIFSIKKEEREEFNSTNTKRTDHLSSVSSASHQDVRGIKSMFGGSTRRKTKEGGVLKKSVSTPSLSTTRRKNSTSDEASSGEGSGDFSKRKLSFNSEVNVSRVATRNDNDLTSFESGFVNNAFFDNVSSAAGEDVTDAAECPAVMAAKTPVIRKALCPSSMRTPRHDSMATKEKRGGLLQSIENTPKIMKPTKGHRSIPGNNDASSLLPQASSSAATPSTKTAKTTSASTKLKVKKGLRVSGQFKRFTSFSKRVSGGGSQSEHTGTAGHHRSSRDESTNDGEDKENICRVTGL